MQRYIAEGIIFFIFGEAKNVSGVAAHLLIRR
jgi:hypothetical protein